MLNARKDVSLSKNSDHHRFIEESLPAIFSLKGAVLQDEQRALFARTKPMGFILFKILGNCENPAQLIKLCTDLREAVGWHCPILIDQEGGRVQRLKPPHWGSYPPCKTYGDMISEDMMGRGQADKCLEENIKALSSELLRHGINVDCAPVLDVIFEGAHDIVGDRGFSSDVDVVTALGRRFCQIMMDEGVTPVIKHIPGHGRALVDSHEVVTVVDAALEDLRAVDFKPFQELSCLPFLKGMWGMVAHCVYTAIDDKPASVSPKVIGDIIRREIGFDGVLVSDDLSMKGLDGWGSVANRAKMSVEAGCDLALYCAGKLEEMEEIAGVLKPATRESLARLKVGVPA